MRRLATYGLQDAVVVDNWSMNNLFPGSGEYLNASQFNTPDPRYAEHKESMRVSRIQVRIAEEARDLAQEARDAAALSAEQAVRQTEMLSALRRLSEELATERRVSAAREDIQQGFNRRMSWAAILLAGAAVIVPFIVLLIEQVLSP